MLRKLIEYNIIDFISDHVYFIYNKYNNCTVIIHGFTEEIWVSYKKINYNIVYNAVIKI